MPSLGMHQSNLIVHWDSRLNSTSPMGLLSSLTIIALRRRVRS